jgi:hypothetical protein
VNHEEISSYWLVKDENNNVIALNTKEFEEPKLVFTPDSVAPDWFNLLRASAVLYQQLTLQYNAIQALIELSESSGVGEMLLSNFQSMQTGILLAQQVAIKGVEDVAASIEAENKMKKLKGG